MKIHNLILLALLVPTTASASERWVRLSPNDRDAPAKNLARLHIGAYQVDPAINPQPFLLRDDPVLGTSIGQGYSERVIQLGKTDSIQRFAMLNDAGAGKVSIYSALTQGDVLENRWTPLGSAVFEPEDEFVDIRFGATDAAYVRVVFEMAAPGQVYEMAVFGLTYAGRYRIVCAAATGAKNPKAPYDPENPTEQGPFYPGLSMLDFNLTRLYAGGQIAYVSSGSGDAVSMIDNDATTRYVFPTSDPAPTVISRLFEPVQVDRVTAILATSEPGTLYLYVLDELPEEQNWTGRPSVGADFLKNLEPTAIHRNVNGAGLFEAKLNFEARQIPPVGQYVALRFVPASVAPAPGPRATPGAETTFAPLTNTGLAIHNSSERCCIVALGAFSNPIGGSAASGNLKGGSTGAYCWVTLIPEDELTPDGFSGPLADFTPYLVPRINSVSP